MKPQTKPMLPDDVWECVKKDLPKDFVGSSDEIRIALAEAGAWYKAMCKSRCRPLTNDSVFRTDEGGSINNYETELIRLIADIWAKIGGTKSISLNNYNEKPYGPQLRFMTTILRYFGLDLSPNTLRDRLRRIYGVKKEK